MNLRIVLACLAVLSCFEAQQPQLLFLTHSATFVHSVVKRPESGELSLAERELGRIATDFRVRSTQDCKEITPEAIAAQKVIAFYTTGELPISAEGRAALVRFIEAGGGFVGIHCATDTFYEWPEFGAMLGGRFDGHPWHQEVNIVVEDAAHPSTRHLGHAFRIKDEIYQMKEFSRSGKQVLLSLDGQSVAIEKGKRSDGDYALSWCRRYGKGRVFYTALGHREEVWADMAFRKHLNQGIRWAAGLETVEPAPMVATDLLAAEAERTFTTAAGASYPWVRTSTGHELAPEAAFYGQAAEAGTVHLEFRAASNAASARLLLNGKHELVLGQAAGAGRFAGIDNPVQEASDGWQVVDISWRTGPRADQQCWNVRWNETPIHCSVELPRLRKEDALELLKLERIQGSLIFRSMWCTTRR